ncbi:MAG: choice-of-anchor A family protein, partial [Ruminiclostridium sp.]|nr:choice-of-anchor A family protein [Ruminiclostridium sp.]
MDIISRRKLSKVMASLVFASAVTGATMGSISASAYDGDPDDVIRDDCEADLGTTVKSILGVAANYNVFLKGNYTQKAIGDNNNIDIGDGNGVIAVGGNYNIGEGKYQACKSATVGGDVTGTIQCKGMSDGEYIHGGIDFEGAFRQLEKTSAALSSLESTEGTSVTTNGYGAIRFKGTDLECNVFNLTVDEWNDLRGGTAGQDKSRNCGVYFDVPYGSTVIVNITGSKAVDLVCEWGGYYADNALTSGEKGREGNAKVLFNIPDANNVVIGAGIGSVLAPTSNVTSGGNGTNHYEGQVIANSFQGYTEFGSSYFDSENPVIVDKVVLPPDTDPEEEETDETEETEETTAAEETTAPEESDITEETTTAEETTAPEETSAEDEDTDPDETTVAETEVPEETTAGETTDGVTYTSEVSVDADTPIPFVSTTATSEVETIPPEDTTPEETTAATEDTTPEETTVATEDTTPEETTAATEDTTPEETTVATEDTTPEETTAATEDTTPEETTAATEDTT